MTRHTKFSIEFEVPEGHDPDNLKALLLVCLDVALWHEADGGKEEERFNEEEYGLLYAVKEANKS